MSDVLLHSPADVLRYALIDLGVGTLPTDNGDWPIQVAAQSDTPDETLTIYDTLGIDDGRHMGDGERFEHHGIQIRVRGKRPNTGWVKAREVCRVLDEDIYYTDVTIDSTTYTLQCVCRTSLLETAGKETPTSERKLFFINAVLDYNLSSSLVGLNWGGDVLNWSGDTLNWGGN